MELDTTIIYTVHVDGRPRASIDKIEYSPWQSTRSLSYVSTLGNKRECRIEYQREKATAPAARDNLTRVLGAWAESAASGSVILHK